MVKLVFADLLYTAAVVETKIISRHKKSVALLAVMQLAISAVCQ